MSRDSRQGPYGSASALLRIAEGKHQGREKGKRAAAEDDTTGAVSGIEDVRSQEKALTPMMPTMRSLLCVTRGLLERFGFAEQDQYWVSPWLSERSWKSRSLGLEARRPMGALLVEDIPNMLYRSSPLDAGIRVASCLRSNQHT
jgi:hypothetical protein